MTRDRGTRYLVVGAGSSGLTAAKNLRERGIEVDVVERNDEVGGNWYFGAPNSRVYASTHMISSRPFTQYPDFPMSDALPDYLHHTDVFDYLKRYADHFGLRSVIEFQSSVAELAPDRSTSVGTTPDAPRWRATIDHGGEVEERSYAGVVVANGHNWFPKTPNYPGQDTFTGEIIHSADYRDPDVLRGKRVLVVGAGNTGCDIAVESAQNAEATYHSTRRGYWYAQKYMGSKPTDQFSDIFFGLGVPHRLIQRIFETSIRITIGDFERHGLKEPDHRILETHPIVNETLINHVGHGDITPVDDIQRFEGDRIVLEDGREIEVDLVIFCTGYLIRFPFLDHELMNWRHGRPHLYRNVFSPDFPNLSVIGLIQPDSGQFNLVHWQSVALARYIQAQRDAARVAQGFAGRIRDHVEDRSTGGLQFVESTRHYVEVEHLDYVRDLDRDINAHLDAGQDPEPVMQRLDWTFPPPGVKRELLEVLPEEPTDRPPLLFVHGAAHGAWCWQEHWMPAAAAAGWPTYAISLRGHGGSEGGDDLSRTPLRHYVHDVLQTITDLPEPPVLVGHSMGTLVVEHVLERYPARAGVLLTPLGPAHGFATMASLARHQPLKLARALAWNTIEFRPELLFSPELPGEEVARHMARLGEESPLVQYQLVLPRRPRPSKAPMLVLGAGDDRVNPPIEAVRTARHYGTRARLFRGMRHDMMLEPDWAWPLAVMLEWLDEHVSSVASAEPVSSRG
ncbi:MAG: alpha/beta fold hydrolase [Nitriliruptorales bacterium]|nr:alpha/beta fold hydrolase [Nitriliruptorales bacterium]